MRPGASGRGIPGNLESSALPAVGRGSAADLHGPTPIDVVTRVASPDQITSPVSGQAAVFLHLAILERRTALAENALDLDQDALVSLGGVVLGDLVTLEIEGAPLAVDVVVRRAALAFAEVRLGAIPLEQLPPELVPRVARASRGGALYYREHLVRSGARLRLRATVERSRGAVVPGSVRLERLVVREDLGSVLLDEVLEASGS